MLYAILKVWVKIGLWFYARKLTIINRKGLRQKGPLVLACNHPNSFFDAVIMGLYMDEPVHFITRGDVFKNKWVRSFLESLHMIPIFRLRDGKEKLAQNDEAFIKSMEVLRKNGILLVFVEGFCEHQKVLQTPLKKHAPRILVACWQEGIPAKVLPVWNEYSNFNRLAKTIHVSMGELFGKEIVAETDSPATAILKINAETEKQLMALSVGPYLADKPSIATRILLALPAMLGAIIHAPLFLPVLSFDKKISRGNVHFNSIMLAMLTILYPFYLLIITGVFLVVTAQLWPIWFLVVFPLLAKAYLLWKKQ